MTKPVAPPFLIVAEVLKPHGVRGEVRVRLLTDFPERIPDLKALYLGTDPTINKATAYDLERVRLQDDYGILKFKGLDNRDDVENWRGLFLMIETTNAVPLDDDEFYTYQLIGMTMITEAGLVIGTIKDIMETGANDVYIVQGSEYGEILIPEVPDLFVELDFDEGVVTVRLPEGLLPS